MGFITQCPISLWFQWASINFIELCPVESKTRVLFVCLGNICRSPLAKALFLNAVELNKLSYKFLVESAGTSDFHRGEAPDERTLKNAKKHGIEIKNIARQFNRQDFARFDHIVVMDAQNYADVAALATNASDKQKISMLREYDPTFKGADVPDPWFGGEDGFEEVYQIIRRSSLGLFDALR